MEPDPLGRSLRPVEATAVLGASGLGRNVESLTGNLPPLHLLPADRTTMSFNLVPSFSSSSSGSGDDEEEDDTSNSGLLHHGRAGGTRQPLGSSSSSEEEWGTIRGGNFHISLSSSSSDEKLPRELDLFVPESTFQLSALQSKPPLPCLSREDLPVGSTVWVVDEDDVKTILGINWDRVYHTVCNGRQSGVVRRHSGELTLVEFTPSGGQIIYTLSVPRRCLSLTAIEPYDSAPQAGCNIMSSGYGALGPRSNARGGAAKSSASTSGVGGRGVQQRLYESPSLFRLSGNTTNPVLASVMALFLEGSVQAASQKLEECATSLATDTERADFFTLRSRIRLFLGRGEEALRDAEECCRLEPQWVRGYLGAARAYSYLGNHKAAEERIRRASVLVPNSAALQTVESLTRFMVGVEQALHAEAADTLGVRLDERYRKRLVLLKDVPAGALLWSEDACIASTLSLFDSPCADCCRVCFSPAEMSLSSSGVDVGDVAPTCTSGPFCSDACRQRASLLAVEMKYHASVEAARTLLRNKMATTVNPLPFELANLTLRLFFIIACMHRRLGSQARHAHYCISPCATPVDPLEQPVGRTRSNDEFGSAPTAARQISLDAVLDRYNVFPLVSALESTRRQKGLLQLLYDIISADLKEEEKQLFNLEFLEHLYDYVCTYFVDIQVPVTDSGRFIHVYYVCSLVSALARSDQPTFKYHTVTADEPVPDVVGRGDDANVHVWQSREEGSKADLLTPNCVVRHRDHPATIASSATSSSGSPQHSPGSRVLQLVTTSAIDAGDDLCLPPFEVDLT